MRISAASWDELEALVDEGLSLCDEYGYRVLSWPGVFLKGLLAAARGTGRRRGGVGGRDDALGQTARCGVRF